MPALKARVGEVDRSLDGSQDTPVTFSGLNAATQVDLYVDTVGYETTDAVVVWAPTTEFEVSVNGTTGWGASASIGAVGDTSNEVPVYVRQVTGRPVAEPTLARLHCVWAGTFADVAAPTGPTSVSAAVASSTSVTLTYSGAADNVGVTNYDEYHVTHGGSAPNAGTTPSHANIGASPYTVTSLTTSQAYDFWVRAKDAAGNLGSWVAASQNAGAGVTPIQWAARTASGYLYADDFSASTNFDLNTADISVASGKLHVSTSVTAEHWAAPKTSVLPETTTDQVVQLKLLNTESSWGTGAADGPAIKVREDPHSSPANKSYVLRMDGATISCYDYDQSSYPLVGSWASGGWNVGDLITLSAIGTGAGSLKVYINGTERISGTAAYTHGRSGMGARKLTASGTKTYDIDEAYVAMTAASVGVVNLPSGWYVMAWDGTNYVKSAVGTGSGTTTLDCKGLWFGANSGGGIALYLHNGDPGTTYNNAGTLVQSIVPSGINSATSVYGGDTWTVS